MTHALGLAGLALLVGCGSSPDKVTVFAAASTADVVEDALGTTSRVSVGATSSLARQIRQGAPADVFVAADLEWVEWLEREGVEVCGAFEVATGRLVVVGPLGAKPSPLGGLEDASLRVVLADPDHVPAGRYARQALEWLGVWESVAARAVRAGNVRSALASVEAGVADRAVVYASDAQASRRVEVVHVFDDSLASPRFVVAVLGEQGKKVARRLREARWADAGFGALP